jgi:hypothetical protein
MTMTRFAVVLSALAALGAAPAPAKPAADSFAAMPAVTPWTAVAASGPVQARPAAMVTEALWRDVARGDELLPQTLVETGRKGRVTLTRSASLLILDPESRVELPGDGYDRLETSIVQTQGSVLYKVDRRSNPHFEVVTPYLVAGVKGTSFLVTVNQRYASVTVQHGRVEITNPATGEHLMLGPGESILRERDQAEMDLVRDRRRSREARKETKRLEQMDRRASERDRRAEAKLAPDATEEAGTDTKPTWMSDDREDSSWATQSDGVDGFGDPNQEGLRGEIDAITDELIEEMIREEIKHGVIRDPIDDVVPGLPPDPDEPTTSPDPGHTPDELESQ